MMFWIAVLALILGFVSLVWSADRFLNGAAATAANYGVSKMTIGLTIVALGTSAPEILVSAMASFSGTPMLAIGNAIGSNIANIGLVLGITAMIAPLPFSPAVLKTELPWLIGATVLALVCLADLHIGLLDSVLLLTGLGVIFYRLMTRQKNDPDLVAESMEELEELPELATRQAIVWLASGMFVLLVSAQVLVWAATQIALELGVSELIIGLTIVAIGTSLPELAATVGSALKGHPDIAIGNVVGSNILNILAVMSVPGMITSFDVASAALWRDYGMMLMLTMLLILFAYGINSRAVITRFEGGVMLVAWCFYNFLLYTHAAA